MLPSKKAMLIALLVVAILALCANCQGYRS